MARYDGAVQLIVVESNDATRLAALVELADEMMEDPRCQIVIPAGHGGNAIVVSVWPDGIADEVEAGLVDDGWATRRLQILD